MSTELYWLWALSCDSRSTSLAIVFFREPSWRLLLFLLVTSSTKMAAGSLKCGSVRRKCSRKLARKAGFIRRLHGRSRKVGSSDYIVYTYVCVDGVFRELSSHGVLASENIFFSENFLREHSQFQHYTYGLVSGGP